MPRKKTHEEFVSEVSALSPDIEIIGSYKKSTERIETKCLICGKIWSPFASDLLAGKGCRQCRIKQFSASRTKTNEKFLSELKEINPNVEILSPYVNSHTKIQVRCKLCDNVWDITPKDLLHGYGCRKCFLVRNSVSRSMKESDFLKQVSENNPNIEIVGKFTKRTDHIDVKCRICGYCWSPIASSIQYGSGCPKCAKNHSSDNRRMTQEEFLSRLRSINSDVHVLGEYVTIDTPILCECEICGFKWEPTPYSLLIGRGCRRCSRSGTSFMEQFIFHSFAHSLGENEVLSRDKNSIGMELDIYIPLFKVAIEPGTWAFHKKSLGRDKLKRNVCKEHGIRLITIYDSYPKTKTAPFANDCYVFSDDYNSSDHSNIRALVLKLFNALGVDSEFTEDEWRDIEQKAYRDAKAKNTSKFIEELNLIRSDVEVIGTYLSSKMPIEVRCKKCNCVWSARPANLLHMSGCPECSKTNRTNKQRKTHKQFIRELKEVQPQIEIIGKYTKGKDHINARCGICGTEWSPIAASLLNGEGCPLCGKKKKADGRRKSQRQFEEELRKICPNIEVIGEYTGTNDSIRVKCKLCGYEWSRQARKLLNDPHHKNEKKIHSELTSTVSSNINNDSL